MATTSKAIQNHNSNTIVVIKSESIAPRPAAAEARKRRKEILNKQQQQTKGSSVNPTNVRTVVNDNDNAVTDFLDTTSVTNAANLVAVTAAAVAAAVASVDLISTSDVPIELTTVTPLIDESQNTIAIPANAETSTTSVVDMPYLNDAAITAAAAAVAMNSSGTATTTSDLPEDIDLNAIVDSNNSTITSNKRKKGSIKSSQSNTKRSRPLSVSKNASNATHNDNDTDQRDIDENYIDNEYNEEDEDDDDNEHNTSDLYDYVNSGMKGNKKTQIRYDPSIPMEKDQLAAWRREARRVRNRESAAASRQRIRGRISELEEEVNDWKEKYVIALEQLQQLQQQHGITSTTMTTTTAMQNHENGASVTDNATTV